MKAVVNKKTPQKSDIKRDVEISSDEEVLLPDNGKKGFERGLEPKKIVGAFKTNDKIIFLMKWKGKGAVDGLVAHRCLSCEIIRLGSNAEDLVPGDLAKSKCPQIVIQYYQNRLRWVPKS